MTAPTGQKQRHQEPLHQDDDLFTSPETPALDQRFERAVPIPGLVFGGPVSDGLGLDGLGLDGLGMDTPPGLRETGNELPRDFRTPAPLHLLRRADRSLVAQDQQPIRRLFDPATALNAADPAIVYINANAKTLINGLITTMRGVGATVTPAQGLTLALRTGDSAAAPNVNEAAADALLRLGIRSQAPLPNPNPNPDPIVELAVRALNYAEREITTRKALNQDIRKLKIGTEFSFGDGKPRTDPEASVNIALDMPKAPKGEQPEQTKAREAAYGQPRTRATERVAAWAKAAQANADQISGTPTVTIDNKVGKSKFAAKTITYTFTDPDWTWYWVADIDEACYETQTMPTAVSDFAAGAIKEIITEHIFKGAAQVKLQEEAKTKPTKKSSEKPAATPLGLRPDPTSSGGGGHLSFDLGTAFGDENGSISVELMLTTLAELQSKADDLAREFRKDTKKQRMTQPVEQGEGTEPIPLDIANAPSLTAQRLRTQLQTDGLDTYTTLVETIKARVLQGNADDLPAIHTELVDFNRTLTNPQVPDGERKDHVESDENISHYQAINIEHLGDDEASSRRVEIRDIPAQTDYSKFLQDLNVLVAALQEARDTVSNAQVERMT